MKRLFLIIALIASLTSCGTVGVSLMEIDQISPAKVTFPEQIHKIGLVDRVNVKAGADKQNMFGISSSVLAEDLACKIADSEYFDDVVLCDSDISSWGVEGNLLLPLQQDQVRDLCEDLQTDMILSLEHVSSKSLETNNLFGVEVASLVRVYVPSKNKPLTYFQVKDSIGWDIPAEYTMTFEAARADIVNFLSESLCKQIVPTWQPVSRYYFDGGNADMRDGGYYVRTGDWDSAKEIWLQAYQNAKGKLKEQYAYNLILCEEMQGNIAEALSLCEDLQISAQGYTDVLTLANLYHENLQERAEEVTRLNLQMRRIK